MNFVDTLYKIFGSPVSIILGIALTIIVVTFYYNLISIFKSSELERAFFTQEQLFVYNIIYSVVLFLSFGILTAVLYIELPSINKDFLKTSLSVLVFILTPLLIISMFLDLWKNIHIKSYKKYIINKLNEKKKLLNTISVFLAPICIFPLSIAMALSDGTSPTTVQSIGRIIVCSVLSTIFYVYMINKLTIKKKNAFYFIEGGYKWYILKPIGKDHYLIGDNPYETKCKRTQLTDKNRIINKDIKKEEVDKEIIT